MFVLEDMGIPEKHEIITPGDTATGIAKGNLKSAAGMYVRAAFITIEANTVNYSLHGTAPTAAAGTNVGHAAPAEAEILLKNPNEIKNFLVIDRVSGSAGVVKVTLFY